MNYNLVLEISAGVVGTSFCWFSDKVLYKYLAVLLFVTVINEGFIVPYLHQNNPSAVNIAYNIFSLLDMLYWYFFFYKLLQTIRRRLLVASIAAIAFIYSFIEISMNSWFHFHASSLSFYNVSILVFCILYLLSLLKREYHNIWHDVNFWLCLGCILYHTNLFVSFNLFKIIDVENYGDEYTIVLRTLNTIANFFYYLFICTAFFIIYYKRKKTTPK